MLKWACVQACNESGPVNKAVKQVEAGVSTRFPALAGRKIFVFYLGALASPRRCGSRRAEVASLELVHSHGLVSSRVAVEDHAATAKCGSAPVCGRTQRDAAACSRAPSACDRVEDVDSFPV